MTEATNQLNARIRYPGPVLLWLMWTVIGSLAYARHYLDAHGAISPLKVLIEYPVWLTCFYPWVALAPMVFRLERRYPLGGARWSRSLAVLTGAALPFSYVAAVLTGALCHLIQVVSGERLGLPDHWWQVPLREIGVQLVLYATTVGGAYVIRSLNQLRQREQQTAKLAIEKAELESTLRQAQLETLRSRLNPHFLFNCLQNISVLTREDPQTASQMLARLGVLLRTALRQDGAPETTLAAEIELTRNYVAVEEIRFADRLKVLFDIAPETEPALVPTFLLQPLVENAVVHGLKGINREGVISIRSTIESENLVITIADNGLGLRAKDLTEVELGIGLASTCERLEKMYPQQHSFSIRPLPEHGTEVRVAIPLRLQTVRAEEAGLEQTALVDR